MTDGEYTTKSTYRIQFEGTFSKLKLMPIWKAGAEPNCRFFAWTLLHRKILATNNLNKRNWPNDLIWKRRGANQERPTQLCKDCPFSKDVWFFLKQWFGLIVVDSVGTTRSLDGCWRKCHAKFDRGKRKKIDGVMIYLWWNIWKEWNRRTLQSKSLQP
jgi:hypothetical protein